MGGCSADVVGLDWASDIAAARAALGPSRPVQARAWITTVCTSMEACAAATAQQHEGIGAPSMSELPAVKPPLGGQHSPRQPHCCYPGRRTGCGLSLQDHKWLC